MKATRPHEFYRHVAVINQIAAVPAEAKITLNQFGNVVNSRIATKKIWSTRAIVILRWAMLKRLWRCIYGPAVNVWLPTVMLEIVMDA
jgi:hypothetical protein